MTAASAAQQDEIFAANRAEGRVALAVKAAGGATRRATVHESGSLRVRCPGPPARELEAVLVNTAGGVAGGDRLGIEIAVGAQAALVVTSAAAEKVYRAIGPPATIDVRLRVEAGGALAWLPQETILFNRAALHRTIEADLAEDATLLLAEAVVFGRADMGEAVEEGSLFDRWRIRRDGVLLHAEAVSLRGPVAAALRERAVAGGGVATGTVVLIPAGEGTAEAVRALDFRGEVGVSAWNGLAVARFCAADGARLRHDLVRVLTALRVRPLPRLWLN